jgi:hypothetical protein
MGPAADGTCVSCGVLVQVAFSVTIPAMLLASTTRTLTGAQPANLLAIPTIAVAQIALGALMGRWAAAAVQGRSVVERDQNQHTQSLCRVPGVYFLYRCFARLEK